MQTGKRKKLTVEIIKAKSNHLWYREKIGQQFKVKDEGHPEHLTASSENNISKIIYREDCKEV